MDRQNKWLKWLSNIGLNAMPVQGEWTEHTCPNCGLVLAKYHSYLRYTRNGPVRVEGGTEVIAFASIPGQ